MKTVIENAKIVTADTVIEGCCLVYEDGIITEISPKATECDERIDAMGCFLVPGFVDIHCHGAIGLSFMGGSEEEIASIANYHLSHGTTSMLATTCTSDEEETQYTLTTLERYIKNNPDSNIVGIFMEGPWLNASQCGAQAVSCMKLPRADELRVIKQEYPSVLRVGAAPELNGGMEFGRASKELGIIASASHTDADFSEIEQACENGYTLMTHLYSGMKGVERRNAYRIAGAVEAGLYLDDMYVEIIADGKHLPLELLKLIYKCKGADKICLITDASRAAGLPNGGTTTGISRADKDIIIVEDDVAKMPDRTAFAGSTATTDRLYRTMASAIGRDMVALSRMASTTPARIMKLSDRGEIAVGKRADLLIVNDNLKIEKVILRGNAI